MGREQQSAKAVDPPAVSAGPVIRESCQIWLRASGQEKLVLRPGVTRVGRDARCEIVLDDPLISRNHAQFVVNGSSVTLEDMGSTNGVEVNGHRLLGTKRLTAGDRVVLGRYEAELCLVQVTPEQLQAEKRPPQELFQTLIDSRSNGPGAASEKQAATRKLPTGLVALAQLADKALHLRQPGAAERILKRPLVMQLESATQGELGEASEVDLAAYFSARLAGLMKDPTWIDYVFKLLAIAKQLPSTRVVDELYQSVAQVPGADITALRRYLQILSAWEVTDLTPGDRFLIRRLEGLAGQY